MQRFGTRPGSPLAIQAGQMKVSSILNRRLTGGGSSPRFSRAGVLQSPNRTHDNTVANNGSKDTGSQSTPNDRSPRKHFIQTCISSATHVAFLIGGDFICADITLCFRWKKTFEGVGLAKRTIRNGNSMCSLREGRHRHSQPHQHRAESRHLRLLYWKG